jgi:hypothetical protein
MKTKRLREFGERQPHSGPPAPARRDKAAAATLDRLLKALEAPPVDESARARLARLLDRHGAPHVTLLIRTIIESEGNANALIEPVIGAVSSVMVFHPEWANRGPVYWLSRPVSGDEIESIRKEVEANILERAKTQWVAQSDCAALYATIARERAEPTPANPAGDSAEPAPALNLDDCDSAEPVSEPPSKEQEEAKRIKVLQCKFNGLVKALCQIAPDIADLVGAYIKTEKISEAAALLLAIVAARHE